MENLRGREGSVSACCQAGTFLHSGQWVTRMMKSFIFFFFAPTAIDWSGLPEGHFEASGIVSGLTEKVLGLVTSDMGTV